jgi:uracil-DNA glycosylase
MTRIAPVLETFDLETRLVIIGAGAAGLVAALVAAEAGLDPLVIERDALPSGSTALSAGLIPAAGTRWQAAAGIADSPELFARDIQAKAKGKAEPILAEAVARAIGPRLEWLAEKHGLAFSVQDGVRLPPSLVNIYKELESDLGLPRPATGNLAKWAEQGVLLLNNTLTVEAGLAGSHAGRGWDAITDAAVAAVAERGVPTVFILWGSHAKKKAGRIPALGRSDAHLVLASAHPSPLSAHNGFFGSRPFSQANSFLEAHGRGVIDWSL